LLHFRLIHGRGYSPDHRALAVAWTQSSNPLRARCSPVLAVAAILGVASFASAAMRSAPQEKARVIPCPRPGRNFLINPAMSPTLCLARPVWTGAERHLLRTRGFLRTSQVSHARKSASGIGPVLCGMHPPFPDQDHLPPASHCACQSAHNTLRYVPSSSAGSRPIWTGV
jgi:hypothetical protein